MSRNPLTPRLFRAACAALLTLGASAAARGSGGTGGSPFGDDFGGVRGHVDIPEISLIPGQHVTVHGQLSGLSQALGEYDDYLPIDSSVPPLPPPPSTLLFGPELISNAWLVGFGGTPDPLFEASQAPFGVDPVFVLSPGLPSTVGAGIPAPGTGLLVVTGFGAALARRRRTA